MNMKISAKDFENGSTIPIEYTCDGENISPELSWSGVPTGTKSMALIMDDPDAPRGTFVHMVMFNIPANISSLPKSLPEDDENFKNGSHYGMNDFGRSGYGGPCPPSGTHRYFFRLYALDTVLDLESGAKRSKLDEHMVGHVLEYSKLVGLYKRQTH
jgi:Raf kinase inhibitor-like YbhB/YbcL family protein